MKRLYLVLLTVALCVSLCSCDSILQKAKSAITGEAISEMPADYITTLENEQYTYELYDGYVKIIEYLAEETVVTIPSEIDGRPVSVIGSLCFFQTGIVSVTIPSSVKTIEASAFYYADALKEITIPDTVEKIEMRAFGWCNALESVTVGKGITEIPDYCFNHCASLTTVEIPDNIKTIGVRAFSYCEKLSEQTVPSTVESIKERAFAGCAALEFVTIENESVSLGTKIFDGSDNAVIIAPEGSTAYDYCVENNLRWSTSKAVEAIVLGYSEETSQETDSIDDSNASVQESSAEN